MVDFNAKGERLQRFRSVASGMIDGAVSDNDVVVGSATAQVVTFDSGTTLASAVNTWTLKINDSTFSFASDSTPTQTEIATGLKAAVNAGSEPVTATGTTTCVVTADVPGRPFTHADLTTTDGTATAVTTHTTANAADGVKAPATGKLKEVALQARIAPAGSDLKVVVRNITKGLDVEVVLTDGSKFIRDTAPDIAVTEGDLFYAVVTQVGSSTAGSGLQITPYIETDF